jgi:hypothetical protein
MSSSDINPYQSPHDVQSKVDAPTIAAVGNRRLKDEASLKQMTIALIAIFALFSRIMLPVDFSQVPLVQAMAICAVGGLLALAAIVGLVVNWGVRSFAPWAKAPLTILCILGLPILPFGTAFAGVILGVVYSRQMPRILSVEYQALVQANPHKSDRISVMSWIAIVLLVILAISLVVISQLPPEFRRPPRP